MRRSAKDFYALSKYSIAFLERAQMFSSYFFASLSLKMVIRFLHSLTISFSALQLKYLFGWLD